MSTTLPHTMSYSGDKPYIFISYAHKDSGIVVPLVQAMQNSGYRVWFDMGIEVGTEWSNDIAAHLRDCALFVAFISKNSVGSENCLDEIAYAKSHQKPALMIFLEEDVVLPEGTEMQTARFQRMYYNRIGTVEGYMASLNNSTFFLPCREEQKKEEIQVETASREAVASVAAPVQPVAKKDKKGLLIGLVAAISVVAIVCVLLFSGVFSSAAEKAVADYVEKNGDEFVAEIEEVFVTASGMTCTSSIEAEGTGFVVNINIDGLNYIPEENAQQMQQAYDSMASDFDVMLMEMQKEIPELTYFVINICEEYGDVLAVIAAGDR